MAWINKNHASREETAKNARGQDLSKVFPDELNVLYQLSFLLTRDHDKAQRCVLPGFEDYGKGNRAFSEWVRSWQKRLIIENAIQELKPQPTRSHSPSPAAVLPVIHGLSSSRSGHFTLEAILALEDFERFVFVISVLEHYSERDCALLLGCSISPIREARTHALAQLSNSVGMVFSQAFTQEK